MQRDRRAGRPVQPQRVVVPDARDENAAVPKAVADPPRSARQLIVGAQGAAARCRRRSPRRRPRRPHAAGDAHRPRADPGSGRAPRLPPGPVAPLLRSHRWRPRGTPPRPGAAPGCRSRRCSPGTVAGGVSPRAASTASNAGAAGSAALAGLLVDRAGVSTALGAGTALAAGCTLLAAPPRQPPALISSEAGGCGRWVAWQPAA